MFCKSCLYKKLPAKDEIFSNSTSLSLGVVINFSHARTLPPVYCLSRTAPDGGHRVVVVVGNSAPVDFCWNWSSSVLPRSPTCLHGRKQVRTPSLVN
jgi:hypothetical protein